MERAAQVLRLLSIERTAQILRLFGEALNRSRKRALVDLVTTNGSSPHCLVVMQPVDGILLSRHGFFAAVALVGLSALA
jgi:hypothetical protein